LAGALTMGLVVGLLLVALIQQATGPHVACAGPTLDHALAINRTWHARAILAIVACLGGLALSACAMFIASRRARLGILLLTASFIGAAVLFGVVATVTDQPCYT
jgi:hypothetical protein